MWSNHDGSPPSTRCKNQGLIFYLSQVIVSFQLKIPNFPYHGNRGSVWENLTYVVKLADLENPYYVHESESYLLLKLSYGEFSVKISKFSLPWQQGVGRWKFDLRR